MSRTQQAQKGRESRRYRLKNPHRCWRLGLHRGCRGACRERKKKVFKYWHELWCWGRLLRVPWTARRSNQSILREINPEYSLEGLMPKLKLQCFGHLMANSQLIGKVSDAGKD